MTQLCAGDLVRGMHRHDEMLVVGCADEAEGRSAANSLEVTTWFCVWESGNRLFEEVFPENELVLLRKDRRRIPRQDRFRFPSHAISIP